MKELTPEQIHENWVKLINLIKDTFSEEYPDNRREKLLNMYQYFEDRINIAGKDAQYIHKNKDNLEISGFVNISYDGKIILNSIQVYDSFADVSFPPFLLSLKLV